VSEDRLPEDPGARPGGYTREQLDLRRRAVRDRRRARRRRGAGALLVLVLVGVVAGILISGGIGGGNRRRPRSRRSATSRTSAPQRVITLPRGGRTILPGHLVVAYYGIVGTSNILGRTRNPEADAAGVQREAQKYARLGKRVQPAFELVATIASPDPGPQGTYSSPVSDATISRYLRVAHRHRLLLILDFQPGRGQFLPEVRRDARFLKDPSVGVALDPEWKLTSDQVPDEAIGSASAASINSVSRYLSTLVARDRLPQKLFIVHEFRLSELPDREHIAFRRGLATVLQMDGLGPVAVKLAAYHQVMHGATGFFPGFKVFLQRSADPVLLSPARVLKLRPRPAYVSYQ
jgi:hypothetical protein